MDSVERGGRRVTAAAIGLGEIVREVAKVSRRPRYTMMVLGLLSEAAGASGEAGPFVNVGGERMTVREWLADTLAAVAERDHRRRLLEERVRDELANELPADEAAAEAVVAEAVRARARAAGQSNVSRAVSDLVRCGYVRRRYAGWRVDHVRHGGQRNAVYIVNAEALAALRRSAQLI